MMLASSDQALGGTAGRIHHVLTLLALTVLLGAVAIGSPALPPVPLPIQTTQDPPPALAGTISGTMDTVNTTEVEPLVTQA